MLSRQQCGNAFRRRRAIRTNGPSGVRRRDHGGAIVWDGFSRFLTPDWDRDLSVTLRTKVWLNEWSRERKFIFNQASNSSVGSVLAFDTTPDAQEFDIEPVPVPQP